MTSDRCALGSSPLDRAIPPKNTRESHTAHPLDKLTNPLGGAPRKDPNGLIHILFVRVSVDMLASLDAYLDTERKRTSNIGLSRADIVRDILKGRLLGEGLFNSE